ncbi:MAG: carbonic anhydrase [Oscillospiraceae bacterium]|jgi:carbonic anhydrase|nr:carbonic anhydrase [Oscillospiraceae bacterium]
MVSIKESVRRLKEGCQTKHTAAAEGQWPFAAVLSCSDSRVPPELIFGCGPGEIFVVRTAGNTADNIAIGSIEFAVEALGVPLVAVLGHTHCGAVEAKAAGTVYGSYMADVLAEVVPDVDENIRNTMKKLAKSPLLSRAIDEGTLAIMGARYDLETGAVDWI